MEIRDVPPVKRTLLSLSLDDAVKDLKTNEKLKLNCNIQSCRRMLRALALRKPQLVMINKRNQVSK